MSAPATDVPTVFPPGLLPPDREPLDLSGLQAAADGACRVIDRLILQRGELRGALQELLDQIDSLDDYQLTLDIEYYRAEANWKDALRRAHEALRVTA